MPLKKKLNSIAFFFCGFFSFAQLDVKFIDHLTLNNLRSEHAVYLNSTGSSPDSIYYYKAKFNLKYPNDSLFFDAYRKSNLICSADSLLTKEAGIYFLKTSMRGSEKWFKGLPENIGGSSARLLMAYKAANNPSLYTEASFPFELQKPFLNYKKAYKKSPFAAAAFSTVVPGLGKLYAGKTKTFFLTFLLNAAYAFQTAESARKLGIKNPFTIVNAAAFTLFYVSNIYGSYHAVIDLKKERKKQFLNDAANFYN